MHSSRREFLTQVASAACACCFLNSMAESKNLGHAPHLEFPTLARDRLAVTSWPFRAYFAQGADRGRTPGVRTMEITEFPGMVAEKFSVYNINPLLSHFRSTDPSYLASFREAVAKAHSHVVDLGLPGGSFASTNRSLAETAVRDGRQWIDSAVAIGSPSVRQHLSMPHDEKPDAGAAVTHLSRLADYGGQHNVVVNLENDSAGAEDPFFIAKVVAKVNHPYLRTLPDFGNSIVEYGPEGNEKAVAAMLEHAFNMCHVKGMLQTDAGKTYHVDLGKLFALAQKSGYRGYFSMEFDTNGGDPIPGTQKLIDETLHYLQS